MKSIKEMIESKRSVEDVVSFLVITDQFSTKSAARDEVKKVMDEHSLVVTKTVSKAQMLKDDFLTLEDPLALDKEDIKVMVIKHDHKAGSIQYYVNSYLLAIDLVKKIQAREQVNLAMQEAVEDMGEEDEA